MATTEVQYVTDAEGNPTGVIVPIEVWREIESERETVYLLKSPAMREQLLAARARTEGIPLGDALAQLGI